jgi:hypothetical protein
MIKGRRNNLPLEYDARKLEVPIIGGFWAWAFHHFDPDTYSAMIQRIEAARNVLNVDGDLSGELAR